MFHKLAKFHCQAVFASQVINKMCFVFHAQAFDDIMTFEYLKLKFDYVKNEKSFQSEIKTFFLVSQVLSFTHTKQTSKNVADTTFKVSFNITNS